MKLTLKRRYFAETYTIGTLFIDGVRFCDTLEDKNRDDNRNGKFDNGEQKVKNETAILRNNRKPFAALRARPSSPFERTAFRRHSNSSWQYR